MNQKPDRPERPADAVAEVRALQKAQNKEMLANLTSNVQGLHGQLARGQIAAIQGELRTFGLDKYRPSTRTRIDFSEPSNPDEQPIFICGLHRSGTSMIEHYVSAHFNVDSLRAKGVPENEGQFLQDVFPHEWPFGGPGAFAFASQMRPQALASANEATRIRHRILGCWQSWRTGSGAKLLEKSPPNITKIRYLRSIFPGAKFIVWTRDPRAVSMATQKWTRCDIDQLMLHWHTAHMAAIDDLQDDCAWLSYEDFCQDPTAAIDRIATQLQLERRATPGKIGQRFAKVANSNQKYLDAYPGVKVRVRFAAWEFFGYKFTA